MVFVEIAMEECGLKTRSNAVAVHKDFVRTLQYPQEADREDRA